VPDPQSKLPNFIDRQDIETVDVIGGLSLDVELGDVGLGGELAGQDHLHRDDSVETAAMRLLFISSVLQRQ
jgi:hypothetical protein